MRSFCVIPARGGSKRIPRKNIRTFCGEPIIAYSIRAALGSGCFEHVIVSTDDDEIAALASELGATVPFRRSAELAGDHVGTLPVVAEAVRWMERHHGRFDAACCVYATAPFLRTGDLQGAQKLIEKGWCYVIAAAEFGSPVFRSFRKLSSGGLEMLFPDHLNTRSQDLEKVFHDAGQFYWGTCTAWREGTPILSPKTYLFEIPRRIAQDIDTEEDWLIAERMYSEYSESNARR